MISKSQKYATKNTFWPFERCASMTVNLVVTRGSQYQGIETWVDLTLSFNTIMSAFKNHSITLAFGAFHNFKCSHFTSSVHSWLWIFLLIELVWEKLGAYCLTENISVGAIYLRKQNCYFLVIWIIWQKILPIQLLWENISPSTIYLRFFCQHNLSSLFWPIHYIWENICNDIICLKILLETLFSQQTKNVCDDIIYLRKHWRSMQMFSDDSRKVPSISEMALWRTRA